MIGWIKSQFRTFRRLYRSWRDQLTTMGKVVFVVMLCTLPTFADAAATLAIVFMGSSVLLLVTSAASYLFRPRLAIHAVPARNWMRSEARVLQLEITNRSRWPVYGMEVSVLPEPGLWEVLDGPASISVLAPRETITLGVTLRPLRRGLHRLPRLQATSCFPLQLVQRSERTRIRRQALILPFYRELVSCHIAQNVPNEARGQTLAMQTVGLTGEYIGSREYQPGVPVRKWDYASWARLGQPVVREFSEPRHPSVALIVDTSLTGAQSSETSDLIPELEAVISLAAAVSEAVIAHSNRVELLTIGERVMFDHDQAFGDVHLAILEHLALARPSTPAALDAARAEIAQLPSNWDTVIFIGQQYQEHQQQLVDQARRQCVHATRILVGQRAAGDSASEGELRVVSIAQIERGAVEL